MPIKQLEKIVLKSQCMLDVDEYRTPFNQHFLNIKYLLKTFVKIYM